MLDYGREQIRREEARLNDQLEEWLEDNALPLSAAEDAGIDWRKDPVFYYIDALAVRTKYTGAFTTSSALDFLFDIAKEFGLDYLIEQAAHSASDQDVLISEILEGQADKDWSLEVLKDIGFKEFDATYGIELEDEIHGK